jgi:hypothetical protein
LYTITHVIACYNEKQTRCTCTNTQRSNIVRLKGFKKGIEREGSKIWDTKSGRVDYDWRVGRWKTTVDQVSGEVWRII